MNHQKGLEDVGCPEPPVFSRPSPCLLRAGVVGWRAFASASAVPSRDGSAQPPCRAWLAMSLH